MKMYTLHDVKAGNFKRPFSASSDVEATRAFLGIMRDEKSEVAQYPDDFELCFAGEWDEQNGIFTQDFGRKTHIVIISGRNALNIILATKGGDNNG